VAVNRKTQLKMLLADSYDEVPDDTPFRLRTDNENIAKIKQEYRKELYIGKEIVAEFEDVKVAGVSRRQETVLKFIVSNYHHVKLVKECQKQYPHAIAVIWNWLDESGEVRSEPLGYVEDEVARDIAKACIKHLDHELAAKVRVMFLPVEATKNTDVDIYSAGLRIDIAIFAPLLPMFCVEGVGRDNGRRRKRNYIVPDKETAIMKASFDGIIVDVESVREVPRE
jgi:hypothetical protein